MDKFIMTVVVILLVYLCVYAIVNRICKCIEHHTEYKYPSRSSGPGIRMASMLTTASTGSPGIFRSGGHGVPRTAR